MVRIGIVGAGRIGQLHANGLKNIPNVEIAKISDPFMENVKDVFASFTGTELVTAYEEVMVDESIDAILVCSPTSTHAEIIQAAARAKKHVFCEKPVSSSVEETENLLQITKEEGVLLQIGFNRRFDPNFLKMKKLVQEGAVGDVHILKITSRDPAPPPVEYLKNSGGLFFDMTIHDFDMARYMTGSEVIEVHAVGANLVSPEIRKIGDIDTAIITLKFANGAIGVIDNSRESKYGYDQRVEVFGSKGKLTVENERHTSVQVHTEEGSHAEPLKNFFLERYADAYTTELQGFLRSIETGEPLVCAGNDGLQAERIARAAKQSLDTNQPVVITHEG
ncbi:inositol 2-dehydrogenase [Lysinibacillus sp. NPDC098008]|uniref:inositol 2-dehydrogenase n=1 Tax=Lysinibacillus sp. NPDC098008 TaxID=3364146 RepID=UPI003806C225